MKLTLTKKESRVLLRALYHGIAWEDSLADAWGENEAGVPAPECAAANARADEVRALRTKLAKQIKEQNEQV